VLNRERFGHLGLGFLLIAVTATGVTRAELELFSQESGGELELAGRSRLEVQGFSGVVAVRVGKPGELRYQARGQTNRREERPVDLWIDDRTLRFLPNAAAAEEPLILEIAVSPGVSTSLELSASVIRASSLGGDLDIRGTDLEIDARGIDGALQLELDGGSVLLHEIAEQVDVAGKNLEVRLQQIRGYVTLDLENSEIHVIAAEDSVSGDLVECQFSASGVLGRVELSGDGGQIELNTIRQGCELELDGTALILRETGGRMEIDTDAEVRFDGITGRLNVRSFGGAVRGSGAVEVDISTHGAEVSLGSIKGNAKIEGDDMTVVVQQIQGDLMVRASSSAVRVEAAEGIVDVSNDLGDTTIKSAKQMVKVASRNGNVVIEELSGPIELTADGDRVEIGWAAIAKDQDCTVANEGGDVWLRFPQRWGGTLRAEAPHGRVESDIPGVTVTDDESRAVGVLQRMSSPRIDVKAGGNVYLTTVSTAKP
jgi:DUF4097 and DUF4098 domain-containing protein YvlB